MELEDTILEELFDNSDSEEEKPKIISTYTRKIDGNISNYPFYQVFKIIYLLAPPQKINLSLIGQHSVRNCLNIWFIH